MKILLLSQFYWPEVRTAPTNLAAAARHLQQRGHQVQVVTGFPNHPFGRVYKGYRQSWRRWETTGEVPILRVPLFPDHSLSPLRRAINYSSFALSSASIGAWLTRRFEADVILVYLPPPTNWLPLRVLQILHRAPVVCWLSDIWPEGLRASRAHVRPWVARSVSTLERAVYRRSRSICVNSRGARELLASKGVEPEKLELLGDWADEEIFFPTEPDPDLASRSGLAGRFNVVYAGNLGPAQEVDTALEAAALLSDLEDLQLVLIGDGEDLPRLRRIAARKKLTNILFLPRQPMNELNEYLALADVLLLHLAPLTLYETQIPSKLMAYMACGRPILCAVAGDSAKLLRRAGGGLTSTPGNPESMARALRELYAMSPGERARLGASGRRRYLERFTRAVLLDRLENLLRQAAGGENHPRAEPSGS